MKYWVLCVDRLYVFHCKSNGSKEEATQNSLYTIFWRNHNSKVTLASKLAHPKYIIYFGSASYIKHKHTQIVTVVIDKFFEFDILKHIDFEVDALESSVPI